MMTAAQNPDGTIAIVLLNMETEAKSIHLMLGEDSVDIQISAQAIQTLMIPSLNKDKN